MNGIHCIVHYVLKKNLTIVKALLKMLEVWPEIGNSIDPIVDSENHEKSSVSKCWVCGHSGRIEIEMNLRYIDWNITYTLVFRHVCTERWYHSDAAYFLVCKTAVGDPDHDESLSPSRGSEVCKGSESALLSWPSLLFCRHDSKVLQNVPEKVHIGVSDGRLGAWYLISFFFKVVSFPYAKLVTWDIFRNFPPSLIWLHFCALCRGAAYPASWIPAFTCLVKFLLRDNACMQKL